MAEEPLGDDLQNIILCQANPGKQIGLKLQFLEQEE